MKSLSNSWRNNWLTYDGGPMNHFLSMRFLSCLALFASLPAWAAGPVLDAPGSGWRNAPAQQQDFVQEVHYPAASVNANGRSEASLIRGRIAAAPKTAEQGARRPARLIVDGIAIPLLTEEDGSFARPWSFGGGSHSVEVRGPGGDTTRRQFYEAQGSRVVANGGALDVDVTTGFGPEIFATPNPVPGAYHVFVNYFGAGEQRDVLITAQVAIVQDEGTPREKQQVFRVPLRKPGELTLVRSFLVP
jgi:uncharacterized protein YfaP (DUF2135 family)